MSITQTQPITCTGCGDTTSDTKVMQRCQCGFCITCDEYKDYIFEGAICNKHFKYIGDENENNK